MGSFTAIMDLRQRATDWYVKFKFCHRVIKAECGQSTSYYMPPIMTCFEILSSIVRGSKGIPLLPG